MLLRFSPIFSTDGDPAPPPVVIDYPPVDLVYTQAVTSTDGFTDPPLGGLPLVQRQVTAPSHLAAHDAGQGVPGLYVIPTDVINRPQILYPGLVAMSVPYSGGAISLTHAPWAAGRGTISIAYRVMLGSTEVATALPYDTTEDAGSILTVFADVTDDNATTTIQIGQITIEENPLGPQLSGFAIDYAANTISLTSDVAATLTWRRYPPNHIFVNQAAEVLAGTGAIDGGSYAIESGANTDAVTFTGGITGPQEIWIVARVGSGPISNVVGGAVDITPAGSSLTAPDFRGSSIGGFSAASGAIPLPAYEIGDLIELPIGINCAAGDVAGITATGPNGEVASIKQALVDNGAGGSSGAMTLMYYRATAANTSGTVTVAITPGGAKNAEQVICTPIARFNVKASGDPYGAVVATGSATAVANATTGELTATSAASRIQASLINDVGIPPGIAPAGWFMREVGQSGSTAHSIQTMSRNDQTTGAGQVIAPVSVPLDASRRWTGLTWEVLPLGA